MLCPFQETLKAAKSHDVSHFEAKKSQGEHPHQPPTPLTPQDSPPSTGIAFDKAAVVRRSLERCYGKNLNLSSSGGDVGGASSRETTEHLSDAHSASAGHMDTRGHSESHGAESSSKVRNMIDSGRGMHETNEEYDDDVMQVAREMEKLQAQPTQCIHDDDPAKADDLRARRTQLGTKAADLFAKLQQRLSAGKT